jgi:hypothetical protein
VWDFSTPKCDVETCHYLTSSQRYILGYLAGDKKIDKQTSGQQKLNRLTA